MRRSFALVLALLALAMLSTSVATASVAKAGCKYHKHVVHPWPGC